MRLVAVAPSPEIITTQQQTTHGLCLRGGSTSEINRLEQHQPPTSHSTCPHKHHLKKPAKASQCEQGWKGGWGTLGVQAYCRDSNKSPHSDSIHVFGQILHVLLFLICRTYYQEVVFNKRFSSYLLRQLQTISHNTSKSGVRCNLEIPKIFRQYVKCKIIGFWNFSDCMIGNGRDHSN